MKWISVKNSVIPEDDWLLLGSKSKQAVSFGVYMNKKFVNPDDNYREIPEVTHWKLLPCPPGENDDL